MSEFIHFSNLPLSEASVNSLPSVHSLNNKFFDQKTKFGTKMKKADNETSHFE